MKDKIENFKGELFPRFKKNEAVFIDNLVKETDNICNELGKEDLQLVKLEDLYELTSKGLEYKKIFFEEYFNTKASKHRKSNTEIEGVYIFLNSENKPIYTGISRGIIKRLRNHGWGVTSSTSTLAYLIAKNEKENKKLSSSNYNNTEFIRDVYTDIVKKMNIFIYPFPNAIPKKGHEYFSLQLLEVLVSVKLQTYWNSFKTH